MVSKDNLKEFAYGLGMDLCGIAGIDRFAAAPAGTHPSELLPGCKSVIVVGVKLLDGVIQANFRAFEDGRRDLKGIYGTYGYTILPNFELTYACYALARYIEKQTGRTAMPCSTGPMTNGIQTSIRHAAVAAGLGILGWMGLVLTPEFGPRNRFGVILTTLELEPDPMYSGKTLCNPEKCNICTQVCPTKALSSYGEKSQSFTMEGRTMEYCVLDWNKCQLATLALTKELGGEKDYITTDTPTAEDIRQVQAEMPISEMGLQHVNSWHCGKCLTYCPAGNWAAQFKKTGLSRGPKI
ncbi:MAG: epoxyqueuosine reductase [Firmicutes bacterium]|nr:epoxyqueuosine reductase [Bacillota bacterium]